MKTSISGIIKLLFIVSFIAGLHAKAIGQDGTTQPEGIPIENPGLFFGGLVAIIIAFILIRRYFKKDNQLKRKIKNTDRVSVKNFVDGGVAKVVGKVLPVKEPLLAPISGKKCVSYHLIIEEQKAGDMADSVSSLYYEIVAEEKEACDFFIADGTGMAKVHPNNAIAHLQKDVKKKMGWFKGADERMKTFLKKYGLDEKDFFGLNETYRFQEGIIEIGEEVAISGQGKWEETKDQFQKREYPQILVFTHSDQAPLHLSDEPDTF